MTRRIPILAAAATLAMVTLVACGGDDPSPKIASAANSSTATLSPPTATAIESKQEVFAKVALADKVKVLDDPSVYDTSKDGSIQLTEINEESSANRHTITLNGKALPYVARAIHLIA